MEKRCGNQDCTFYVFNYKGVNDVCLEDGHPQSREHYGSCKKWKKPTCENENKVMTNQVWKNEVIPYFEKQGFYKILLRDNGKDNVLGMYQNRRLDEKTLLTIKLHTGADDAVVDMTLSHYRNGGIGVDVADSLRVQKVIKTLEDCVNYINAFQELYENNLDFILK